MTRRFALAALFLVSACAPSARVKPGFDFSRIHRLFVGPFEGEGGSAVAGEFMRALLAGGLEIVDRPALADAVLTGAVTEYKPSQKLMIILGETTSVNARGQTVVVSNPVVSISGSQVSSQGPAFGLPHTQVVSVSATVGVVAHLVDVRSGTVVWSDGYSYEGLDVQGALQAVTGSLTRSLARVIPPLRHPPS